MYNSYFGFSEKPFTIAPNPRYLYMSERHQEALAHMLYGMQGEGGVMVLTGEVGTGKTTICRRLLEQVPENTNIAYIINPKLTALELLASICDELHISYPTPADSIKVFTDLLNEHLLISHAKGLHTVLIIDEAQNLDSSVLEQLRLLTNLETNEQKLLQIMLLGQPELAEKLQRKELRQLAQRITARYHLTPLDKNEVSAYLNHRLAIAGCESQQIFPAAVVRQLFKFTRGVPRLINLIADRALLGTYSCEKKQVSRKILAQSVREVCGDKPKENSPNLLWAYISTLLVIAIGFGLFNTQMMDKTADGASTSNTAEVIIAPQARLTEAADRTKQSSNKPEPDTSHTPPTAVQIVKQEEIPFDKNQDNAFKAVFNAWRIDYQPERDGDACLFAKQHQLQCLRQRGGIANLRNLSRPAVLTISDDEGYPAYVAITALKGSSATAQANDKLAEITLSQLVLQSHNDFTILWRTPKDYAGPVRPGQKGKLVQLLAEKCTQAENQQWFGAPRLEYDLGLKEQVKSFQKNQGLKADGVAGPITWIHINSLTDSTTPTLQKPIQSNIKETVEIEVKSKS